MNYKKSLLVSHTIIHLYMDGKELQDKGILAANEKVVFQTTQRRVKNAIHPTSIIVTDKQIIIRSPKLGGAKVSAFGYGRLQNVKIKKKFFTSSIEIKTMTDKVDVGGTPKNSGSGILRAMRSVM